ncbi:hypothetical protein O181_051968 [Austropuccinia psidii MF-1]|uniref:Reverse transcriptase domain-containing protein n=1 Tax=Austropuccinia psidii MF-1 TaxID=1389203 RepID=A0A9Q3E1T1_9BASI|nr:hypothetical protein [Austropuccinia psidii MF-1]
MKNGLITYDSSHKESSGINSSASNALATAVNSVALVGELKTPSLSSSAHIPSIMPSQSLLKSRDEVFKEIKVVGEDVAISSLHLFKGDMDLPPLFFHGSLVEHWCYLLTIKQESETLQAYTSDNVEKGFIRPSSSSIGAPVLFVKKKDGGLHLCIDYHKLNAVTRKNRYPVPPMNQLLTLFNSSTIFSKIELHGAYNLLRIKEGDEHLTALRAKYGSYEYLVMPFGLTNAPASFQNIVNDIFADFLDIFVVVSLDDIMVFSSSEEEQEALSQFQIIKEAFTTAPILSHFNPSLPTIVETDASHYALGSVLTQAGHFTRCLVTLGRHVPREEVDFISNNPQNSHQIIKQDGIQESRFFSIEVKIFSDLVDKIQKEVWQYKNYEEIIKQLERGESVPDYSLEPQAKLLSIKDRVVIPSNEEIQLNILQRRHDSLLAGHPGQEKTLKLIKRDFYLAGMNKFIKDHVS